MSLHLPRDIFQHILYNFFNKSHSSSLNTLKYSTANILRGRAVIGEYFKGELIKPFSIIKRAVLSWLSIKSLSKASSFFRLENIVKFLGTH